LNIQHFTLSHDESPSYLPSCAPESDTAGTDGPTIVHGHRILEVAIRELPGDHLQMLPDHRHRLAVLLVERSDLDRAAVGEEAERVLRRVRILVRRDLTTENTEITEV
jgi:hypothetical protein